MCWEVVEPILVAKKQGYNIWYLTLDAPRLNWLFSMKVITIIPGGAHATIQVGGYFSSHPLANMTIHTDKQKQTDYSTHLRCQSNNPRLMHYLWLLGCQAHLFPEQHRWWSSRCTWERNQNLSPSGCERYYKTIAAKSLLVWKPPVKNFYVKKHILLHNYFQQCLSQ